MRAHTIAATTRTFVPAGILALSLAVVLLAATASTASAGRILSPWNCPPPSTPPTTLAEVRDCLSHHGPTFDFGDRQLGTTSPAQHFVLGVYDNDSFNPEISVSGDYAQTNDCPPTLSAGDHPQIQGCLITVTFTPTSTGPRQGTLSAGTGAPAPALAGNGVTHRTPRPGLHLFAEKRQDPQADTVCDRGLCNLDLRVSCGVKACAARAEGKLSKVKEDKLTTPGPRVITRGQTRNLGPELRKASQRREVRRALDEGKTVKAKVTVRVTYAAGKVESAKRTIKLVEPRNRPPGPDRSGVAAAGVMALGAQTAAAAPNVVKYDTDLTITKDRNHFYHGSVTSEVRKCMERRRVVLFTRQPGADRKVGTSRSDFRTEYGAGYWGVNVPRSRLHHGDRLFAKLTPKVRNRFVCRADRSETMTRPTPGVAAAGVMALGAQTAAAAPDVVKYDTKSVIDKERGYVEGRVYSEVRKCMEGRRVVLFIQQPGTDRKIGTVRTEFKFSRGDWIVPSAPLKVHGGARMYAQVMRKVRDRFVCRADRSQNTTIPAGANRSLGVG